MANCICFSEDPLDIIDRERYGCPDEICPGCFCDKPHDDWLCRDCERFQHVYWRVLAHLRARLRR